MAPAKQQQQQQQQQKHRALEAKKRRKAAYSCILQRRFDLLYAAFFIIHIPIMLCVDLLPIYPDFIKPQALLDVRTWYAVAYADKNFIEPTAWFTAYMWMEAVYHLPLSIWAVGALIRNDPLVPVHLLAWGMQTFITTATCLVDAWSWTDRTSEEKYQITILYGPYMALAGLMMLDMFFRLKRRLAK